ncbi:MAG: hypothetical protein ACRC23_01975 [Aeromonas jandaei]
METTLVVKEQNGLEKVQEVFKEAIGVLIRRNVKLKGRYSKDEIIRRALEITANDTGVSMEIIVSIFKQKNTNKKVC